MSNMYLNIRNKFLFEFIKATNSFQKWNIWSTVGSINRWKHITLNFKLRMDYFKLNPTKINKINQQSSLSYQISAFTNWYFANLIINHNI